MLPTSFAGDNPLTSPARLGGCPHHRPSTAQSPLSLLMRNPLLRARVVSGGRIVPRCPERRAGQLVIGGRRARHRWVLRGRSAWSGRALSAARWTGAPTTPTLRGSDDDLDEVWVESVLGRRSRPRPLRVPRAHAPRTPNRLPRRWEFGCLRRISRVASMPSIPAAAMSISTTSGRARRRARPPRARRAPARDSRRPSASSRHLALSDANHRLVLDYKHPPTARSNQPSSPRVRHRTTVAITQRPPYDEALASAKPVAAHRSAASVRGWSIGLMFLSFA